MINAKTIAGDRIYFNAPVNTAVDKAARVSIQSLSETSEKFHETPRRYKKEFMITLELTYSSNSGDYIADEIEFENFIQKVDEIMVVNEKFDDPELSKQLQISDTCVSDSTFAGIEYRTEPDGEFPVYIALLKYSVEYYQQTGQGDADLDDLDKVKSDITPSGSDARPFGIESEQEV